jgi:two-component SAPR family response regulator
VLHALGKDREAAKDLTEALNLARQIKSKSWEHYALMAEALFALDRGEEDACLAILRRALTIGREEGYLETFIDQPSALVRLCQKALEAGIEVEHVQSIIRKRNLVPEKPPLYLGNWPWPIKIYTLGRFEIRKEEKPIRFSRKTQQRPLSMIKALIAFGGKGVREDQISDALWPEAEGDIAYQSFKITLHRLRQLLGYEKAIQRQEGRLTLDPRYCWVDVWAFEQILEQAEARWKEGKKEVALGLMEKATEMYGGAFLGREIEKPWATSLRERLRGKFLRSVGRSGLYWQQAGRWEKALDCYHKGLEIDPLAEEFYQGLMTCHQHLGQRAEALSVYNRCKRALSQAFGVEPSAKTEAIYRSLHS